MRTASRGNGGNHPTTPEPPQTTASGGSGGNHLSPDNSPKKKESITIFKFGSAVTKAVDSGVGRTTHPHFSWQYSYGHTACVLIL